jgi:hypothetical protein
VKTQIGIGDWKMNAVKDRARHPYMVPTGDRAVKTTADTESLLSGDDDPVYQARVVWQTIINQKLEVWLSDPTAISDQGLDAPSQRVLRIALDYAESFRDQGMAAPDRVIPDPNGGIVFRRREGNISEVLHILDDGVVDYQKFRDSVLIARQSL